MMQHEMGPKSHLLHVTQLTIHCTSVFFIFKVGPSRFKLCTWLLHISRLYIAQVNIIKLKWAPSGMKRFPFITATLLHIKYNDITNYSAVQHTYISLNLFFRHLQKSKLSWPLIRDTLVSPKWWEIPQQLSIF